MSPLVLARERVERQADQQGGRQHPEALEEVGVEGMGQAQPETEPHRQGNKQGISGEQEQAALLGRLPQKLGCESSKSHKKSPCRNRDRGSVGWVVRAVSIALYGLYRFLNSGDPDALGSRSLALLEPSSQGCSNSCTACQGSFPPVGRVVIRGNGEEPHVRTLAMRRCPA